MRIDKNNWKNLVETASVDMTEQFNKRREDEEKFTQMAQRVASAMNQQVPQVPSPGPGVQEPFGMGEVKPLETGAPGAMSMDIGLDTLAQSATKQPPMDLVVMPPMDMGGMPPMDMGGMPPMDMMGQEKEGRPSFDELPGLPPVPPTGMPSMGGMPPMGQQPPAPEQQEMKPSDDFGARMGIPSESPRHHMRSTKPEEQLTTGPKMPFTMGPQTAEMGSPQGQEIPASLVDQPSAPPEAKEQQPPLQPGQTRDSQNFVTKYTDAIKVQLKDILDRERDKFTTGQFMESLQETNYVTAMPASPVASGARASIDKMLGIGTPKHWENKRNDWLKYWK